MPSDYDKKLAREWAHRTVMEIDGLLEDGGSDLRLGVIDGYGFEDEMAALIERARKDLAAENRRLREIENFNSMSIDEGCEIINEMSAALAEMADEELTECSASHCLGHFGEKTREAFNVALESRRSDRARIETLEGALRDVRDAMRIRAETGNYSPADMAQVAKNIIEPHMAPPSTPAEEEPEA